jgi:hypothetical protein
MKPHLLQLGHGAFFERAMYVAYHLIPKRPKSRIYQTELHRANVKGTAQKFITAFHPDDLPLFDNELG